MEHESCQEKYMNKVGIKQFYNTKYDAKNPDFWKSIEIPNGPDKEYVCIGVKASNYFMPKETLSEKGPGGGGWILMVACSEFGLSLCNHDSWPIVFVESFPGAENGTDNVIHTSSQLLGVRESERQRDTFAARTAQRE